MVVEVNLPPLALSPNQKPHRMKRGQAAKRYREDCYLQFIAWRNAQADRTPFALAQLQLEFFFAPAKVPDGLATFRDTDNADASCKALQDALKDARIIAGDDSRRLIRLPSILHRNAAEHLGKRCIRVTLRELAEERK